MNPDQTQKLGSGTSAHNVAKWLDYFSDGRRVVARQQLIHRSGPLVPRPGAVAVAVHHEARPGIELLVLHVTSGEVGAEQVPGKIEQLHAVRRRLSRHRPIGLEGLAQLFVLEHRRIRRHLEHARAHQLAHRVADLRVVVGAPVQRRIDVAAVDGVIAVRMRLAGVDLAHDQAFERRLHRGEPAERELHRRHVPRAVHVGDLAGDADDQLELSRKPHVGLVVGHGVAGRAHVDRARHLDVVVAEHALPRHLHVLEQHRGVVLVEARGERIVELAHRVFLVGLARPDADAGRVERHDAGNRLLLLPGRDRLQIAAPGLVAERRRGAEHFQPIDGDAAVVLGHDAQGRRRSLVRVRHPPALRIGHRVRGEDVVVPHMPVVVLDVVAESRADAVEQAWVHHEPAHIAWEIVGRAAEQPMRPGRDAPVRLETLLQILAPPRQQEITREGLAALLEGHHLAVFRRALAVIDHGEGARGVAERRMRGHVVDPLAADIDPPAVADAFEIFLAGQQHGAASPGARKDQADPR